MARRRPNRIVKPTTTKSLPATNLGGQVYTAEQVQGLLARQQDTGATANPLPRDYFPYNFGPNVPLIPAPLDPTRRSSGRAEPRLWEYPVSWNLPGQDSARLVPWRTLRDAANLPLIRDCIRIRKAEIHGLEWDFTISRRAVDRAQRDTPDAGRLDVEKTLRDRLVGDIDRAVDFWQVPDRGNGYTFSEWISQFVEEQLVLDALAIYPRYTLGGDLYSMEILDGTTIKPLLDHRGGRPQAPQPAYQQIIHGFPRGEFTADTTDTDSEITIPAAYTADQMIYIRREVRTHTPYGLSPVEQALMDIDLWQKRVAWLRAEYTDGAMPASWLINEQTGSAVWTPAQVTEYEIALNDHLSGNTANRMRHHVLPPGIRPDDSGSNDQAERYKPEFDLHLLKLVVAHFDMTVHELGFTEAKGLGSDGHAEGQDRLNERKGRMPVLRWIAELITDMSRAHLGLPRELEFKWLGLDDESDNSEDEDRTVEQVSAGLITVNEGRDLLGRPRYHIPEADKPAIINGATITFIEGAEERAQAAMELEARAVDAKAQAPAGKPGEKPAAKKPDPKAAKKAAEATAYRRWAAKGRTSRRFELEHIVEPADLIEHGIDPGRVTFQGKASAPERGALDDIADRVTAALLEAMSTVDAEALAGAWRGREATKGLGAIGRWVREHLFGLVDALRGPVEMSIREGWEAGVTTAADQIGPVNVVAPAAERLQELLDDVEVTISSIADSRFEELAEVLEESVARGDAGHTLASELREVLDAPQWAETVAVTETARSMSAATQATYQRNSIMRKRWILAPDQRVCDACEGNADQGAIDTDDKFAGGVPFPPQHPHCRCSLMPVIDGLI